MKLLKSSLFIVIFFSFFLFFATGSQCQELQLQKVTEHLYMISAGGGNIAFLVTEKGVLVVDAGSWPKQGEEIVAAIRKITNKAIKYLIYTHYHYDHISDAQNFPSSVKIISHENTRKNLENIFPSQLKNWINKAFPEQISKLEQKVEKLKSEKSPELKQAQKELERTKKILEDLKQSKLVLPDYTFNKKSNIYIGGKKVKLFNMGHGHTDGDTIVYFPEEKVVHMGDLLFHERTPYIDMRAGSDTENWIKTLEKVSEMDIVKVIPGHGEITDKNGLQAQVQYLIDLCTEVQKYIDQGVSLEETKTKIKLPKYENMEWHNENFLNNVEAIYKELAEKKKSQ